MATSSGALNLDSLILSDDEREAPLVVISTQDEGGGECVESCDSDYEAMARECVETADALLSQTKAEREEKTRRINQARMDKQKEREEKQKGFVKKSAAMSAAKSAAMSASKSAAMSAAKSAAMSEQKIKFSNSSSGKITGIIPSKKNENKNDATQDLSSTSSKNASSKKIKMNQKAMKTPDAVETCEVSSKHRNVTIQDFDVSSTDTYSDYESDSDMNLDHNDIQFVKKQPKLFTVRHLNDVAHLDVDKMFDSESSESTDDQSTDNQKRCYYSAEKSANAKRRYKSNYLNKRRSKVKSKNQEDTDNSSSVLDPNYLCASAVASPMLNKNTNNILKNRIGKSKNNFSNNKNEFKQNKLGNYKYSRHTLASCEYGKHKLGNSNLTSEGSKFNNDLTKSMKTENRVEETAAELDDFVVLSEVCLKPELVSGTPDKCSVGSEHRVLAVDLSDSCQRIEQVVQDNGQAESVLSQSKCCHGSELKDDLTDDDKGNVQTEGSDRAELDGFNSKCYDDSLLDDCVSGGISKFKSDKRSETVGKKGVFKSDGKSKSNRSGGKFGSPKSTFEFDSNEICKMSKPDEACECDDELFKFEKGTDSSDEEIDWKAVMENRSKAVAAPTLVLSSDSEDIDFKAIMRSRAEDPAGTTPGGTQGGANTNHHLMGITSGGANTNHSDSSDIESQFNSCLAEFSKK